MAPVNYGLVPSDADNILLISKAASTLVEQALLTGLYGTPYYASAEDSYSAYLMETNQALILLRRVNASEWL